MCSELFRIPVEAGGVPIFGFGVLLVVWLLGAGGAMAWSHRKGASRGELLGFLPLVAIVAAAIIFLPRAFPDGLPIRGYGVMLLIGASSGLALAVHRAQQSGLDADTIFSLSFWLFVFGIVGARLFFVIEYWDTRFADKGLWEVLTFTEGGLVVYGSLIGATAAFIVYCVRHKLPVLAMADIFAPSLVVGLAIGRIGCLLNGCCYGGVTDAPWALTFPMGSPAYTDQLRQGRLEGYHLLEASETRRPLVVPRAYLSDPGALPEGRLVTAVNDQPVDTLVEATAAVNRAYWAGEEVTLTLEGGGQVTSPTESLAVHPTQVYSAVNAALLAWLLWSYYPYRRRDGEVIGQLLAIYPISRFLLEEIRVDESAVFGTGLSISQNVSIAILVGVAVYWAWLLRRPRRLALVEAA